MNDNMTTTPEEKTREERLKALRESIQKGEYEIDTHKTAEAMLEKASARDESANDQKQTQKQA